MKTVIETIFTFIFTFLAFCSFLNDQTLMVFLYLVADYIVLCSILAGK